MPWYGELPECWGLKRVGNLFSENTTPNANLQSDIPMQFRFGEIIRKRVIEKDVAFLDSLRRYIVVQPNDIMVNGLNLNYDFITQRVAIVREEGCMTPAYISLRPKSLINPHFACYLLKAMDGQKILNGLGTGIRLTLGFLELKKTYLPLPPRNEQDQIVRYLDWKVSQINKLINAKRRQISLLQEQKRAIINGAVTRGGEGWQEIRLGNLGIFRKGFGGSRIDDSDDGVACIRYGDIYRTGVLSLTQPITRINAQAVASYARVYKSEVLFALSGETKEEIGQALVNNIDEDTWCSGDAAIFTANKRILPQLLAYIMRCPYIVKQRASLAKGDIIVHISTGALRQLRILVPPITEQEKIIIVLERKCLLIDKAIVTITNQIPVYHEYRTRLISDVVTGKVDVRGVDVPEYEAVEDVACEESTEDIKEMGDEE